MKAGESRHAGSPPAEHDPAIDTTFGAADYSRTNDFATTMYLRPRTLEEACDALAKGSLRILSGGTDIYPALVDRPQTEVLLDISRLQGLDRIDIGPDTIRIGGRTTWRTIAGADLPPCFDALRQAAREVGGIQIQNAATIAGNICNASPAADGVPPLLALDAAVELVSSKGTRLLRLDAFILRNRRTAREPGEIVTAILVPRSVDRGRSVFLKLGARRYLVISIAMVAAVVEADAQGRVAQARVAVGACSEVARRLADLERDLVGRAARPGLGTAVTPGHVAGLAPIDDVRASAAYRLDAVCKLVARALDAAVAGAEP
jgi:CO/xanthine dehydrogenase FAD-binding subunit